MIRNIYSFMLFISFTLLLCISRILESIEYLGRELVVENDNLTFTRDNFALVLGDVDTNDYRGQTFTIETDIDELHTFDSNQISTASGEDMNSTGACSFTLPESLFDDLSGSIKRISYAVFSDDSLFQPRELRDRQVGGVIISVDVPGVDKLFDPVQMRFQIAQVL